MKLGKVLSVFISVTLLVGCSLGGSTRSDSDRVQFGPDGRPIAPGAKAARPFENRLVLVVGGAGVASYATVGILKKFHEEGVDVEFTVATGWPAVFALAHSYLRSVHDLEWFATRLVERDFEKMGKVDFRRDLDPSDSLDGIILKSLGSNVLNQGHSPVVIASTNTDLGEPDVFSAGDWKEPLLRTASIPGLYRRFPGSGPGWVEAIRALEVREAARRGASAVVVVSMYDDFIQWLEHGGPGKDDELIRRVYAGKLRKSINEGLQAGTVSANIRLGRGPKDFSAKRAAILAGYREAGLLLKKLRDQASPTAN